MSEVVENKALKLETLKKRSDFLRVASTRKKWITPAMVIQISDLINDDDSKIEVGFTASKKVGNAVARSRAKRRMREVAKKVLTGCGSEKHAYVLIARQEILVCSFDQLIRDLKWALKRLHGTS
jgi:ribonuclease P protein component